jgi:hypothetical protein
MNRRLIFCAFVGLFFYVALAGKAAAYPQFQFSSGTTRCSQCHYSPAGGGLITSWGRDESGDTLSFGGDGAFLNGAWTPPSSLALGADVRLAATRLDSADSPPHNAFFPMQFDLYARYAFTDSISLYVEGGVRGEVRQGPGESMFSDVGERLISREHYLMWRPSATGAYVRLGRFFPPYGLRLVEHIYYVRRYAGFNLYNEPYGASGGYVGEDWELHLSGFVPPPSSFPSPLQSVGARDSGGAAYFEKQFAAMAAVGLQARVGFGGDVKRYQGGVVGKLWFEPARLLFLGEADVIHLLVNGSTYAQNQLVSYAGLTFIPVRGLMIGGAYEHYQEDLKVQRTSREAFDLQINVFPWAHWEVVLLARQQILGQGETDGSPTTLLMAQLHYYL